MAEPILVAGSNQKWDVLLGIVVGAGCVLRGRRLLERPLSFEPHPHRWGVILASFCCGGWILRRVRRAWAVLHDDSFTLQESHHEEEIRDDDIFAMSLSVKKNYSNGVYHSTTRVFTVWAEQAQGPRKIVLTTRLKANQADLLAPLVQRIADRLREEARRTLDAGHPVEGKGWKLDREALVFPGRSGTESLPLADVTAADIFDRHVCVWRRGVDEPAVRFPENGENAWILLQLLQERAANQHNGDAPAEGLGRVLFERRPSRAWAWIGFPTGALFLLLAALAFVAALGKLDPELFLVSLGTGALGLLIVVWTVTSRRRIFRCHEYGVHCVRWFRERRLRYPDVAAFTCHATRMYHNGAYAGTNIGLIFEPTPESGAATLRYATTVHNADEEIDMLRDHVARVVAGRMAREFSAGQPVRWLDHLTFDAEGLTYRPAGFIGRKEPIFIPYGQIRGFDVETGTFRLWTHGQLKSVVNESVAQRNFFPGYTLLTMLFHSPPSASREEPAEPVWN